MEKLDITGTGLAALENAWEKKGAYVDALSRRIEALQAEYDQIR